jgi:hypothetical protein
MITMMRLITASLSGLAIALSTGMPVYAQEIRQPSGSIDSIQLAQVTPTAQEVVDACVAGQVTTLPNPYTDVAPDHWAYEAVLNMYYCGVIRPGLPPSVVERLTGIRPTSAS